MRFSSFASEWLIMSARVFQLLRSCADHEVGVARQEMYCWLVVGPFSARDVDILFKDEADIVSKEFGTCA